MGNRHVCAGRSRADAVEKQGPIVPDKDPLTWSLTRSENCMSRISKHEISRDYEMTSVILGTGYSGAVRLARHRRSQQEVAVKQLSKRRFRGRRLHLLQSEVEVYLRLDHPNICRLLHAYENKHDVWLVMERCACELYSRVRERRAYFEVEAAEMLLQMLQAVNYLHSHRIVHRDLKLENWMVSISCAPREESGAVNDGSSTDGLLAPSGTMPLRPTHTSSMTSSSSCAVPERVKLIDFGFSKLIRDHDENLQLPCGTIHYTSPEVLSRNYTSKCDIWSLGVITFMLLMGKPPFRGANNVKIAKAIATDDFPKDSSRWRCLSPEAQDFVTALLQKDPTRRPDASAALAHPWIQGLAGRAHQMGYQPVADIGLDVLQSLRRFAHASNFGRVALTAVAYGFTSQELQDLEATFLAFDRTGSGTVGYTEFEQALRRYLDIKSDEVLRIFSALDMACDQEVRYTPFIAALLAARVQSHEDKVRAAFQAFDVEGKGYITADSLLHRLSGVIGGCGESGFTMDEAQQWIKEVDYQGNGTLDYGGFVAALSGKKLHVALLTNDEEAPEVRIFEDSKRPRGCSESALDKSQDSDSEFDDSMQRSHSYPSFGDERICARSVVRSVPCAVEEGYFPCEAALHGSRPVTSKVC
mmetsp:Transcript_44037/g.99054  ORF Transcript_44037/g.99054 Transcript_44037/m.99054 type:complete len:642 (-) Transcript_44037:243-2168(-)